MVDENKAVVIGQVDVVIREIAFLMDKICSDKNITKGGNYDEVFDSLVHEVDRFKADRKRGIEKNHPHEKTGKEEKSASKKERATAAENALMAAMKEIEAMKAEKAAKAEKKKKKKKGKK